MTDPIPTPDGVTPEDDTPPADQAKPVTAEDLARVTAALDKERDLRKAAEKSVRDFQAQQRAAMPEAERAIEEARSEARAAALREVGGRLVDAELRAAAAGRPIEVDALLEVVDRSRFITEDGDVDRKALAAWVDRIAPAPVEQAPVVPSFDGGARTTHTTGSTAQQFAKALGQLI